MGCTPERELIEVRDCNTLCPCWIGEDPDNGTSRSSLACHIVRGGIDGVEDPGLDFGVSGVIPGHVLASPAQEAALIRVFRGPVGEEVDARRAAFTFGIKEGKGTLRTGEAVHAVMEPHRGPTGEPPRLAESIVSTIPGSPAFVSKASGFRLKQPGLGIDRELRGHGAIPALLELRH